MRPVASKKRGGAAVQDCAIVVTQELLPLHNTVFWNCFAFNSASSRIRVKVIYITCIATGLWRCNSCCLILGNSFLCTPLKSICRASLRGGQCEWLPRTPWSGGCHAHTCATHTHMCEEPTFTAVLFAHPKQEWCSDQPTAPASNYCSGGARPGKVGGSTTLFWLPAGLYPLPLLTCLCL